QGTYVEDLVIQGKSVKLWGRCPDLVMVKGTSAAPSALQFVGGLASKSEVHGLAITGASRGLVVGGASAVVVSGVWVHDTEADGIHVEYTFGPTSVELRSSLIEAAGLWGIVIMGAGATIEGTIVRDTKTDAAGTHGWGMAIQQHLGARANLTLHTSIVERNHDMGIAIRASDVAIEGVVVKGTETDGNGQNGVGVAAIDLLEMKDRANVALRSSVVEQSHGVGVQIEGSDATIEGVVVRDTLVNGQDSGFGIQSVRSRQTGEPSKVAVVASLIERSHGTGVGAFGSAATLEGVLVRDTELDGAGTNGLGIAAGFDTVSKRRGNISVRASVVERSYGAGVFVEGSDATIESTAVRDTELNTNGECNGFRVQLDASMQERSNLIMRSSLVEGSHRGGVRVTGSDATIEAMAVRDTSEIGIWIANEPMTKERANATVRGALIERSGQVGVAVTGSDATIA